jgi:hypothetical protein
MSNDLGRDNRLGSWREIPENGEKKDFLVLVFYWLAAPPGVCYTAIDQELCPSSPTPS